MKKTILIFFMLVTSIIVYAQSKLSKPEKNFESFWNTFNDKYAHFSTRNVDWEEQYRRYRSLINSHTTDADLYRILNEMVEPLKDGHVVISKTGDLPASAKHTNLNERFPTKADVTKLREVIAFTLDSLGFQEFVKFNSKEWQIGGYSSTNYIGYLQLNGFGGMALKEFERQLDDMLSKFEDKKAVIVDVRINGGGSPDFVEAVVSRFINEKLLVSYGQSKIGKGADDFTPVQAYYTEPNSKHLIKPLIILTSGASISAADHFVMHLKGLPYVTIIGENTAGMFSSMMGKKLPNGWEYSLSNDKFFSRDKICYEGTGVPVDIKLINTQDDIRSKQDQVLIAAIGYINNNIISAETIQHISDEKK